jgi:hypothetical protein
MTTTKGAMGQKDFDESFVRLEAEQIVDRYKTLENKNRAMSATVIRLYILLLLFAAAPFSVPLYLQTGFLRVWGFGGMWLAIVVWMYFDRSVRSYGKHIFERIFCLRHLSCLRSLVHGNSEWYKTHSLLVTSGPDLMNKDCGDPTHLSSSQMTATVYFYKVLSLFPPLYLVLFISLVLQPREMLDPSITTTRLLYFRFLVGFSAVMFLWLATSTMNCFGIQREAFRARRISRTSPWPLFPSVASIDESYHRTRTILFRVLGVLAGAVATANLVRIVQLLSGDGIRKGWQTIDIHLAISTGILFLLLIILIETDARYLLSKAKQKWHMPKDWLS